MSSVDIIIFGLPQRFISESFSERERVREMLIKITVAHFSPWFRVEKRERNQIKFVMSGHDERRLSTICLFHRSAESYESQLTCSYRYTTVAMHLGFANCPRRSDSHSTSYITDVEVPIRPSIPEDLSIFHYFTPTAPFLNSHHFTASIIPCCKTVAWWRLTSLSGGQLK